MEFQILIYTDISIILFLQEKVKNFIKTELCEKLGALASEVNM